MFDYPIPIPGNSFYDELGVPPEATDADLRAALDEVSRQFKKEAATLGIQIAEAVKAAAGADAEVNATTEAKAASANPAFRGWCDRRDEIARRLDALNAASLDKPEKRAEYDARFPPFGLLKTPAPEDPFADHPTVLALVRRAVSDHLAARGVPVAHPTDLTRTDFTGDFTPNPVLDGAPA